MSAGIPARVVTDVIRIAFTQIGGIKWKGGQNYLYNLLQSLLAHERSHISPVLFLSEDCPPEYFDTFENIDGLEIIKTRLLNKNRQGLSLLSSLFLGRDQLILRLFQEKKIDVIFESARYFGWSLPMPAISWIPDFQHRHLPNLFSGFSWWKRDLGFIAQIKSGRTILLSSDDALKDCKNFYSVSSQQLRRIHFAIPPHPPLPFAEARRIADRYSLPEKFFFLPNQFWRHKNHQLIIDALNILKQQDNSIVIAASGGQSDPRDPSYFPSLQKRISEGGLEDSLVLLGLIPSEHIGALMQASVALINPSLFEGWSTTVEEARQSGTPLILSDLQVHYEQAGDNAIYFDRHSAESLAVALSAFEPYTLSVRERMAKDAYKLAGQRYKDYALQFRLLTEHVIRQYSLLSN